jgi:hypothetical protein
VRPHLLENGKLQGVERVEYLLIPISIYGPRVLGLFGSCRGVPETRKPRSNGTCLSLHFRRSRSDKDALRKGAASALAEAAPKFVAIEDCAPTVQGTSQRARFWPLMSANGLINPKTTYLLTLSGPVRSGN